MLVIPAIDIIDGACVRLTKGDYNLKKKYSLLLLIGVNAIAKLISKRQKL